MRAEWVLILLMAGSAALQGQSPAGAPFSGTDAPKTAASPQAGADAAVPYHVGNGVSAPKIIRSKNPGYSLRARLRRVQGTCLLTLVVDAEGNPRNVRVERSIAEGLPDDSRTAALELDRLALDAVKQYKFRPGMYQGKPVAVEITVGVGFRMS